MGSALRRPVVGITQTGAGAEPASVACVTVGGLALPLVEASAAHVAAVEAPASSAVLWLAVDGRRLPAWNDARPRRGEVVLQAPRTIATLRADGPSRWGGVAIDGMVLAAATRALLGREIVAAAPACILRPAPEALREIRHLHGQACRLARHRPALLARPEVARALEQDLIHALVWALATDAVRRSSPAESA